MPTLHVGIREAKIQLSKYLKMVQKGSEVILTDRGKPVGKIIPIANEDLPLSARIKRLEVQGVIQPYIREKPKKIPAPIPVAGEIAQKYLDEDRKSLSVAYCSR